jgi:hypothetical protein
MPIGQFVSELITQAKRAAPEQLDWLVEQVGSAPFAEDLLEVDEPLWGGFWQGDVIAPGYSLPAVELALLRAIRLDRRWPEETSVAQFLADLHQALSDPHAGVWTLFAADEPCVIFASLRGQGPGIGAQSLATVVWYCATTERLHAGYRTPLALNFSEAVEQRRLDFLDSRPLGSASHQDSQSSWLEQAAEHGKIGSGQPSAAGGPGLAARLDAEILHMRRIA